MFKGNNPAWSLTSMFLKGQEDHSLVGLAKNNIVHKTEKRFLYLQMKMSGLFTLKT